MKNTIGIYANWKPTIISSGYDIPWIHEKYICCLQEMFDEVTILTSSKSAEKMVSLNQSPKLRFLLIPYYQSFMNGHFKLFHLIRSFTKILRENNTVFVRYPEPLIWALLLLNIFYRKKISVHIVSNPFEVISSRNTFISMLAKYLLMLDLYLMRFFSFRQSNYIRFSCNGVAVPDIFKKCLNGKIVPVIETSFRSYEFFNNQNATCKDNHIFKMVIVSRIVKGKRILEFVRFLSSIDFKVDDKDLHLDIIGDGSELPKLKKYLLCNLNAAKHVRLLGFMNKQSDIFNSIYRSDCSIITSESESGPRVFLESLFVGRPVIATDVGYVYSLGDLGETVFPLRFNDYEGFRNSVRSILAKDAGNLEVQCKSTVKLLTIDKFFKKVLYGQG